jgi:hypothetical protein
VPEEPSSGSAASNQQRQGGSQKVNRQAQHGAPPPAGSLPQKDTVQQDRLPQDQPDQPEPGHHQQSGLDFESRVQELTTASTVKEIIEKFLKEGPTNSPLGKSAPVSGKQTDFAKWLKTLAILLTPIVVC